MAIKFGDRLVNINPDYALIDLSDNQARGVAFFQNGITESALSDVPEDKRLAGMLGVDVANDKVFIFTGSQAEAANINLFHIAPLDAAGNPVNQQPTTGTASGGTYWEEIGTVERRFANIPVAIGDGKTFGKYRNDYDHPSFAGNIGVIPVTDIGAGQGMTALEIIIEALSEAQPIPIEFDVFDNVNSTTDGQGVTDLASDSNPDGQFAFGQTSGTVGYSITATNINVNLTDDNGVAATLDTNGTSATCAILSRRRGSGDAFTTFVSSITLQAGANNEFTASGTAPWSTTDQFDDFDGFEFKVEIVDTIGMTGSALDSIGVSTYVPPVVTFTAERNDDMIGTYITNESDAHRMPGNVNTVLNWTIDPQVQDGLAGSEIEVTGYQIYRKVLETYDGTPPGADNNTGWSTVTGGDATGISIQGSQTASFTLIDTDVPHAAKFLAYKIVVIDDHLSTLSEANTYYEALPAGASLEANPSSYSNATAIAYYASFSEQGTTSGARAHAEMKAPLFWFNANIAGATLSDGNSADNIAGLTAFPTSLPATFNSTFGNDTLTGYSGAFFNANSVHHGNSKQLALSEASSPAHGFPTTFNNYTSGASDGNRLIIAIPDPYGNTPSEITNFISNLNSNNVITGFQSGLVDISLPTGPATGGDQVDPLPVYQYRIYVSTNANAFAASQNITVQYS